MIREPVVRIQPGRHASRLGNDLPRKFLSITLLCRLSECRPTRQVNTNKVVEAADRNLIAKQPRLRLKCLDGIVVGAVTGKNRRKPGCLEYFSDWIRNTVQSVVEIGRASCRERE